MLHETIRNDDFYRNTALHHCCNIAQPVPGVRKTGMRREIRKQEQARFQIFSHILLFLHYLDIDYIGSLICISTLRNNVRNKDNKKSRNQDVRSDQIS